jgi:ketosteroid isomerase-like protein
MSKQNVQLVERVLGEAQHNPAALWAVLDDDVLWEVGALELPDAGATQWRGPAGVREFFRRWTAPFDDWGYEVDEVIDAGDSVIARIRQWGRGKGSGATVESHFWQAWTIRDGKVVRGTHHAEKHEVLRAVGLREEVASQEEADRSHWEADLRGEDVLRRRLG